MSLYPISQRDYRLRCSSTRLREALYSPANLLYGPLLPKGRIERSAYRLKMLSSPFQYHLPVHLFLPSESQYPRQRGGPPLNSLGQWVSWDAYHFHKTPELILNRMVSVKGRYLTNLRMSEMVLFYLSIYLFWHLLFKSFLSYSRYSEEVVLSRDVL